jgi:putative transposase
VVGYLPRMRTPRDTLYAGYRCPAELISYAVWLYFRFPLSLRMAEEMPVARGIAVTYETIRQWGLKLGREFANRIRRRAPCRGDKWHLDEVVITIAGDEGGRRSALAISVSEAPFPDGRCPPCGPAGKGGRQGSRLQKGQ